LEPEVRPWLLTTTHNTRLMCCTGVTCSALVTSSWQAVGCPLLLWCHHTSHLSLLTTLTRPPPRVGDRGLHVVIAVETADHYMHQSERAPPPAWAQKTHSVCVREGGGVSKRTHPCRQS